jgi:hypothetical protein
MPDTVALLMTGSNINSDGYQTNYTRLLARYVR